MVFTRKGIIFILPCIKYEEMISTKAQIETRGASNETVSKGDPKLTKLIEDSVYDNNPVYYISMVS